MDKILIHLSVPIIQQGFDMYIPVSLPMQELTGLLARAVENNTDGAYVSSGNEIVCIKEKNEILAQNLTVWECNIQNGDHLVMI